VNAILCSDRNANPLLPEAQVLTRLLEAQAWTIEHFDRFGGAYFTDRNDVRSLYGATAGEIMRRVAVRHPGGQRLVLDHLEPFAREDGSPCAELGGVAPRPGCLVGIGDPGSRRVSFHDTARGLLAGGSSFSPPEM
jgi:hypothetical protein